MHELCCKSGVSIQHEAFLSYKKDILSKSCSSQNLSVRHNNFYSLKKQPTFIPLTKTLILMKKKNFKNLTLNKKAVSNLSYVKGGVAAGDSVLHQRSGCAADPICEKVKPEPLTVWSCPGNCWTWWSCP